MKWLQKFTLKQIAIGIVSIFLLFLILGIFADDKDPPTAVIEEKPTDTSNEEAKIKQQRASEDLETLLTPFKNDPLKLVSAWHPDGINDEIFVVEVDPDLWSLMLYDEKEGLVRDVGNLSNTAGYNSVWFIDNRTRDKLADYRHGRVEIE